ncbi:UNVERIFIED_CONTAM: GNAT family N-acetyltransferase, partial [Salmonella enterica subsp. enterica serovar Weltevreden]
REGLAHSSLVSVQGSEAYWARQGYAVVALAEAEQRQRLAGYGPDAVYMERRL